MSEEWGLTDWKEGDGEAWKTGTEYEPKRHQRLRGFLNNLHDINPNSAPKSNGLEFLSDKAKRIAYSKFESGYQVVTYRDKVLPLFFTSVFDGDNKHITSYSALTLEGALKTHERIREEYSKH